MNDKDKMELFEAMNAARNALRLLWQRRSTAPVHSEIGVIMSRVIELEMMLSGYLADAEDEM